MGANVYSMAPVDPCLFESDDYNIGISIIFGFYFKISCEKLFLILEFFY